MAAMGEAVFELGLDKGVVLGVLRALRHGVVFHPAEGAELVVGHVFDGGDYGETVDDFAAVLACVWIPETSLVPPIPDAPSEQSRRWIVDVVASTSDGNAVEPDLQALPTRSRVDAISIVDVAELAAQPRRLELLGTVIAHNCLQAFVCKCIWKKMDAA